MLLHDPVVNTRVSNRYEEKVSILQTIIEDVVRDSRTFIAHMQPKLRIEVITPLLLHSAYQARALYGSLVIHDNSTDAEAQGILRQKLILVGKRWNAGGTTSTNSVLL